jgi:hypothetical protein
MEPRVSGAECSSEASRVLARSRVASHGFTVTERSEPSVNEAEHNRTHREEVVG